MTDRRWLRVAAAMFGVGWGANQFAPLLLVYRAREHVSEAAVTAMFGVYALGLIPALLLAGRLVAWCGAKRALRLTVLLSVVASLVLVAGAVVSGLLFFGRFLAGVASGVVLNVGTARVKDLSAAAPEGAGARRAAIALSAGFGGGPLLAGAVAQWLPAPTVLPYVLHLALMVVVVPLLWRAPDSHEAAPDLREPVPAGAPPRPRRLPAAAREPRFGAVAVWAPWVFGTATIGFATLPTLVAAQVGGDPVAFNGAITGLTLLTGVLIQPVARRLRGHHDALPPAAGLLTATAGLALAALTAATRDPLLVLPAAVLLGSAYGILLVSGLQETQRMAGAGELTGLLAIFYALTYVGFGGPYLLAELAPHGGYARWLLVAALGTLVSAAAIAFVLRRYPTAAAQPCAVTPS